MSNDDEKRPYCDCIFPDTIEISLQSTDIDIHSLTDCRCGELAAGHPQWQWHVDPATDVVVQDGRKLTFHPHFSQGAAVVRGNRALDAGQLHYWEIRMITAPSGTDIMIGIGTDRYELNAYGYSYKSALGPNTESWGYSYTGRILHDRQKTRYGKRYTQGSLIGVYLDRVRGYLEFYLNRRPLGIAFRNIPLDPNVKIYPMCCSTSAKSAMQLINATSLPDTLQLRAFQALNRQPAQLKRLAEMPGLKRFTEKFWLAAPPVPYSNQPARDQCDLLDEVFLPNKRQKDSNANKAIDDCLDPDDDFYWIAKRIGPINLQKMLPFKK